VCVGVTLGATVDVGGWGVSVAGGVAEGGVELGLLVGEAVVGMMDAVAVGVCDGTILVAVAEGDGSIGLGVAVGVAEGVRVSVGEGVAEGTRVGVWVGGTTTTGGTYSPWPARSI